MPAGNPTAITLIRKQDPKGSVRAATTAALPANTRAGNVLTADANGALPAQDGVTLVVADPKERLLAKDEATGANNGIYDVTDVGSGSTKWVLTRSPDFDQDEKVTSGAATFVSEGTVNAGREFTLITADPITVNTTALVFTQTGGTTPVAHDLGGAGHNADTLANLNTKVSDATLDDSGDSRTPSAHALGGAEHSADTLANLNAKVSDATLDDSGDARTPSSHALGGAEHSADTLANLNSKVSDATLIDTGDSRLSDARAPTAHASDHTDGTDDIQDATAAQKGLATAAQITKLDGIATGADVTGSNAPQAHATSHENGGSDEINVGGLSGLLADAQTPAAHTHTHASTTGQGADDHHAQDHAARHADGGADEVPVAGLAEAAAPSNNVSQALRPDGSGGVAFSDVAFADLTGQASTAQVADNAITNAKLADVATKTIKGRTTAATGDPEDLTAAQARAVLGITLDYFELQGDQFTFPVDGDKPASIVRLAPSVPDSINAGRPVLRYDATDEEARGFARRIETGAVTMQFTIMHRAQTSPGDTIHDVGWKLYYREVPDGGASPSVTWTGANDGSVVLTEITNLADDVFPHKIIETITLASLTPVISPDLKYDFLISRVAPAGTNLVGDWIIEDLEVEID